MDEKTPEDKFNIEKRAMVLKFALGIESLITKLLAHSLAIFHDHRKAFSNKSGNLSAKNRIDLLFDLEMFTKEEHGAFLLFFEYRNQFMHNPECNTFENAVEFLGNDKEKRLMKFNPEARCVEEQALQIAFLSLTHHCHATIVAKIEKRKEHIAGITKMFQDQLTALSSLSDQYEALSNRLSALLENEFRSIRGQAATLESEEIGEARLKLLSEMMSIISEEGVRFRETREELLENILGNLEVKITRALAGRDISIGPDGKEINWS